MQRQSHTHHRYKPAALTEAVGSDGNLWRITIGACACGRQQVLAFCQLTKQMVRN
jgi:hypothetical protein